MKSSDISKSQKILEYINSGEYKCMTVKQLAVIFSVSKDGFEYFEKLILKLEKAGSLYIDDSKRVCKLDDNKHICRYEVKSYGFGFGIVINLSGKVDKIYIAREDNLGAFDGDLVLVDIKKNVSSGDLPDGRIIKIIQKSDKKIIGIFDKSDNFGFVKPISSGIDDIYIPNQSTLNACDKDRVLVRVTKYPSSDRKAEGKIIEIIGNEDTKEVEHLSVFASHNISINFPDIVTAEAETVAKITESDLVGRKDLRDERIYTIDGDDAKDFDDAVSVKVIDANKYKLSVHIADVSKYVREGTELDREAIKRGTSIYTPGKVVPMLPVSLSNGICSLNENEDRLTLSVDMTIDLSGEVIDSNIYKAVIRSKKRMTYSKVEKVLDNSDPEVMLEYKDYEQDLRVMYTLSQILQARREKRGSINFDLPESKIELDFEGNVSNVLPYEIGKSNKIIEEFMLVANRVIAETFFRLEAPFIYRVHEAPDIEKLKTVNTVLSMLGTSIKGINKVHPKAIADVVKLFKDDKNKSIIVSNIVLRALKLAKYSDLNEGHFGLNFDFYPHFTSPIRRYPDLFIHRVISKYIENNYVLDNTDENILKEQAKKYAFSSSECEKQATEIERELDDIYKAKYMKAHLGEEYDGIVSSVTKFGIYVKLANTIQGLITLSSLEDDYYIYDEQYMQLVGERTKRTFKIGDTLKVIPTRADSITKQIDFSIVGGNKK